jgi:hypothetical protein
MTVTSGLNDSDARAGFRRDVGVLRLEDEAAEPAVRRNEIVLVGKAVRFPQQV